MTKIHTCSTTSNDVSGGKSHNNDGFRPTKKKAVIYVGRPKSGKDTQTEPLLKLGEPVLVTGKHLKNLALANPNDPRYSPIIEGRLVDDSMTTWVTKRWIVQSIKERPGHNHLHLNGVPRRPGQICVIPFLQDLKYDVYCVWFTTPHEVCEMRLREGRFEDEDPNVGKNRKHVYETETIPMLDMLNTFGICEESGNLLKIDNTNLTPVETAAQLIAFLSLPYHPRQMFPDRPIPALGQFATPK